jgi:predicted amidohydrolase
MSFIKIAGVQMDIKIAARETNLQNVKRHLATTVAAGAALTIFPECTLSGYCFESMEETLDASEKVDGSSISELLGICADLQTHAIVGFLERDETQDVVRVFNTIVCIGPDGVVSKYRKIHLPTLGVDNFTTHGDQPFEVFDLKLPNHETPLRIGMNICYDCSFPEAARILTLKGADLIALPTNWPPGSGLVADIIPNTRSLENNVYFAAVNRIGQERGFEFIGKSKICDPLGRDLDFANHSDEQILYGEIDVAFARKKHLVAVPGKHEVHRINDRRPDAYGPIIDPLR